MILAVGNTKGGVGKTTTTIQLATYLKAVRKVDRLWVIDGDEQHSTLEALTERNNDQSRAPIACASYSTAEEIMGQVRAQKDTYDHILIDIGGRDTEALRAALLSCDALLIPVVPRALDLKAMHHLYKVMQSAWSLQARFSAYAFLSCADVQGSANSESLEYMQGFEKITMLDAPLSRRKSFAQATAWGLSVTEDKPKDAKACAEVESLINKIYMN